MCICIHLHIKILLGWIMARWNFFRYIIMNKKYFINWPLGGVKILWAYLFLFFYELIPKLCKSLMMQNFIHNNEVLLVFLVLFRFLLTFMISGHVWHSFESTCTRAESMEERSSFREYLPLSHTHALYRAHTVHYFLLWLQHTWCIKQQLSFLGFCCCSN